jgi:hypothetical protein
MPSSTPKDLLLALMAQFYNESNSSKNKVRTGFFYNKPYKMKNCLRTKNPGNRNSLIKTAVTTVGIIVFFLLFFNLCRAQGPVDTTKKMPHYKNVIRYNLSGALLFGMDQYIVLGYERVISPRQSFSVNVGRAALPGVISVITDSFTFKKDQKTNGQNLSVDYRFYLAKENKFETPHGFYIGPYYSFNHFKREGQWAFNKRATDNYLNTYSDFYINTLGFQVGYQLVLWKRLMIDFVMAGPGFGIYKYKTTFDGTIDALAQEQLFEGLEQLITQKFPGMDFVFEDKSISSDGIMRANTIGYRYIFHIGFAF